MNEGLFHAATFKGRCKCAESKVPLKDRDLTVYAYYPVRVWGRAARTYDGRKLLRITCNRCGATWKDYDACSPVWELIGDDPLTGEETYYVKRIGLISKIRRMFYR